MEECYTIDDYRKECSVTITEQGAYDLLCFLIFGDSFEKSISSDIKPLSDFVNALFNLDVLTYESFDEYEMWRARFIFGVEIEKTLKVCKEKKYDFIRKDYMENDTFENGFLNLLCCKLYERIKESADFQNERTRG